jgi:hypothetical protein
MTVIKLSIGEIVHQMPEGTFNIEIMGSRSKKSGATKQALELRLRQLHDLCRLILLMGCRQTQLSVTWRGGKSRKQLYFSSRA